MSASPNDSTVHIAPPANDAELAAFARISNQAFASQGQSADFEDRWLSHIGREHLRLATRGGEVVGGLGILYFGQWFGGRAVPSAGISSVAVAPQHRGTGVAKAVLHSALAELAERVPISCLYPSTYSLYRAVGYEPAGMRFTTAIANRRIGTADRRCLLRPIEPAQRAVLADLHNQYGQRHQGVIQRTEREWANIFDLVPPPPTSYAIEAPDDPGRLVGYIIHAQQGPVLAPQQAGFGAHSNEVAVVDFAFLTPAAGRRILGFLADLGTMVECVTCNGSAHDPLLALLPLETRHILRAHYWMLRILDVRTALQGRGYPAGLSTELHLNVRDELLPRNHGRFILTVADGQATVEAGGRGDLSIDIRGLAPLYTSMYTAEHLALVGLAEGDGEQLAQATLTFTGPAPWMNDRF